MIDAGPLAKLGYAPLPVKAGQKGCFRKGWPTLKWSGKAPGIALRLDGLAMLDFDTEAADIIQLVLTNLPDTLIRHRPGTNRRAALFRVAPSNFYLSTPKWKNEAVEVKAGNGHLMFAFGTHPSGGELYWTENGGAFRSPAHMPALNRLPEISQNQLAEAIVIAETEFQNRYGNPNTPGISHNGYEHHFDLQDGMRFSTTDGETFMFEELRAYAGPGSSEGSPAFNLTPWRPDSDSMTGRVGWSERYGCHYVVDHAHKVLHFEVGAAADTPVEGRLNLRGVKVESFFDSEQSRAHRPPQPDIPWIFVQDKGHFIRRTEPLKSPVEKSNLTFGMPRKDALECIKRIPQVERTIWDPGLPPCSIVQQKTYREFNTFTYPAWAGDGEVKTFRRMLRIILPDDMERQAFEFWLAAKVQRPHERLFPVALVGPPGSGKTTLWTVLQCLWGASQVALVGTMERAFARPFQDYLYRKVYTFFDEVTNADAGNDQRARLKAANMLKVIGDVQSSTQELELKYARYANAVVAATVGVTTNDIGALPLERGDRRWAVFQTGGPLKNNPLHTWVADEGNRAAYFAHYSKVSLTGFDSRTPLHTLAKGRMIELGETELDDALSELVEMVRDSGGYISETEYTMFQELYSIVGPRKTAARNLYKRAFPNMHVVKILGKTRRVRALPEGGEKPSGVTILEVLQRLQSKLNGVALEHHP